jgi:hypothetical protein
MLTYNQKRPLSDPLRSPGCPIVWLCGIEPGAPIRDCDPSHPAGNPAATQLHRANAEGIISLTD